MRPEEAFGQLLGFLIVFGLFWVLPITVGIRAAHRRNRSGHWMWFGLHPLGGYVMMIIMLCLKPLKMCPECGKKSRDFARICPYCQHSFATT